MSGNSQRDVLNLALALQWISRPQIQKGLTRRDQLIQQGKKIGILPLLERMGVLSNSQISQLQRLVAKGYHLCIPCGVVYPLDSGDLPPGGKCRKCNRPLKTSPPTNSSEIATAAPLPTPSTDLRDPSKASSQSGSTSSTSSYYPPPSLSSVHPPSYEIKKTLGQGGYGRVYQVRHPFLRRPSALKVLTEKKGKEPHIRKRFLREILVTAQLEHPNIMPVYEGGYLKDGAPYFVMKELRGGTLKEWLDRERENKKAGRIHHLKEYLEIFYKVADAVDYAHSRGVIHRDLKPSNIAVGEFGEVMVLDWGIAKCKGVEEIESVGYTPAEQSTEIETDEGDENLTMDHMLGTPGYMSPEQAKGEEVTSLSDIFSLGVILYEILTLEIPFPGNIQKRIMGVLMGKPTAPVEKSPDLNIPEELSAIAMKALSKDTSDRYSSVRELKDDVLRFEEGYSVSAKKDTPWQSLKKWVRRNKTTAVAILLGTITFFVALGGWWYARHSEKQARQAAKVRAEREKEAKIEALLAQVDQFWKKHGEKKAKKESHQERIRKLMKIRSQVETGLRLAPEDEKLRAALYQIERELGLAALAGGNYLLSQLCFERCKSLGHREEARELLRRLAHKKSEKRRRNLQRVDSIMKELHRPPEEGMVDEYVTEIVRLGQPYISRHLLSYLDSNYTWVRRVAIEALGKLGHREVSWKGRDVGQWLMKSLREVSLKRNQDEAEALIWALGRLRDKRANDLVYQIRSRVGQTSSFWSRTTKPYNWIPLDNRGGNQFKKLQRRALMNMSKGRYRQAVEDYSQILRLKPKSARAYCNRGAAYSYLGKVAESLRDFRRAERINPDEELIYYNRAFLYYDMKEYHLAKKEIQKALKLKQKYPQAVALLGMILVQLGERERGLSHLNESINLNPEDPLLLNNRGMVFNSLGMPAKAIEDFNRSIELAPNASTYLNRGAAKVKLKDYKGALDDFNQVIRRNPRWAKAYNHRGQIRYRLGDYQGAISDLSQAIQLNSKNPSHYFYRALTYQKLGKLKKALSDYSEVIKREPKNGRAFLERAMVKLRQGNYEGAQQDASDAIHFNPRLSRAYLIKGIVHMKKGENKEAEEVFTQGLKVDPRSDECLVNRGMVRSLQKKYGLAEKDFTRALALSPQDPEIHFRRGLSRYEQKKWKKAEKDFRLVINLKPEKVFAYLNCGLCLSKQEKHKKAVRYLKIFLKKNPTSPQAKELRKYIEKHGG